MIFRFRNRLFYSLLRRIKRLTRRDHVTVKLEGKGIQIKNEGYCENLVYDIAGDNNIIEICQGSRLINVKIYMRGNNHFLKIEENCEFKGGSVWFEDSECTIEIKKGTTIESAHLAATEPKSKISVGSDCMFSNDIEIRTGDSHSIFSTETGKRINYAKDIVINDHVWIGTRAIILKGVTIQKGSVISAGAIVTKNIPANVIAGVYRRIL